MAAEGCHFVECSLYAQLINIELFSSTRNLSLAQSVLYKIGPLILSSTFCFSAARIASAHVLANTRVHAADAATGAGLASEQHQGLPASVRRRFAFSSQSPAHLVQLPDN